MSETAPASDAAAGYVDAVKWIVGLAGAVFAGVFLHPEWILGRPEKMRIYLAVVLFLFGISMIGGVVYLLWINSVRRKKEVLGEVESELSEPVVSPDPKKKEDLTTKRDRIGVELKKAQGHMNLWYAVLSVPFYVAAFLGVVAFCVWVAWPQKSADDGKKPPTVADPLRFTITQSAVHRTKKGMEAHTFLLNQQTGEVWQMVCDGPSGAVSFRRVPWLDLNKNPEKVENGRKP
jgi:hypothetical protein